ncbi:hypothetical protein FBY03_11198 [Pseudomonas sp. SJZ079]|uniref:hypothetical protein n=1 Tax=Pseudomonas sp. SJZ079 TaxID=2572887 RepID=UPI00119C390C|nr:hypothetical protein [Pseudomonas sp. SJZ079]TWC35050.1 hypothetical protein FBY03_11198 [Pseudomonas sp. SJZ079]
MLINGALINAAAINAGARRATAPIQTEVVVLPEGARWSLRVMLGSVDISARLTGRVKLDIEANAARFCHLSLVAEPGLIDLDSWSGKTLQVYRRRYEGESLVSETLRFTGLTLPAQYDHWRNVIALSASCDRQNRLEQMSVEQIDALVPGHYATAVSGELTSHYEYAEARRQTLPIDLDCAPDGALRVTSWRAAAVPHFAFGADAIIAGSLRVVPATEQPLNKLELTLEYRYVRLRHREHGYVWEHPAGSFCVWLSRSSELPTLSMLTDALSQADWDLLGEPSIEALPPSMPDPCGNGGAWINTFTADPHMLGFTVQVARRTAQTLTERYSLVLEAPGSIATFGERLERERYNDDVDYDSRSWEALPASARPTGATQDSLNDWVVDQDDAARRSAVLLTGLHREAVRIEESHRRTRVTWLTPITDAVYDTAHTCQVDAGGIQARGKVAAIQQTWDLDSGSEIAAIELAIYRGGEAATADELVQPPRPEIDLGAAPPGSTVLATQLGGDQLSPPYDEALDGFAGNYSVPWPGSQTCPRRLQIATPDIDAAYRDPTEAEGASLYRLNIPTDLLITEVA